MKQWFGAVLIAGLVGLSSQAFAKPRQHPIGECLPMAEAIVVIVAKTVGQGMPSIRHTQEQLIEFANGLQLSDAGKDLLFLGIPSWHRQFEDVIQLNENELMSIYSQVLNSCIEAEGRYDDGQAELKGIET